MGSRAISRAAGRFRRRAGGGLLLVLGLMTAGAADPVPVPSLDAGVRAYLAADTPDARRAALATVRAATAPFAQVRQAVERAFTWGPAPTGSFYLELQWRSGVRVPCHVFVPPQYDPARAWPLIIGLHGIWAQGDQITKPIAADAARRGYLVACPTTPTPWWTVGPQSEIFAALRHMCRTYHVDTDRVHLLGISLGGFGAWQNGLRAPDRWATILAGVAGVSFKEYLLPVDRTERSLLVNAGHLACWMAHGSADPTVPVRFDRRTYAMLRKLGYECHYYEKEGAPHDRPDAATLAEVTRAAFDWADAHRREPRPREVSFVRVDDLGRRAYWVRIDDARGIAGVTAVAGADNRIEVATLGRVRRLTLFLGAPLVDLDRPIEVVVNGRTAFAGPVARDPAVLLESARERFDPRTLDEAEVRLEIP